MLRKCPRKGLLSAERYEEVLKTQVWAICHELSLYPSGGRFFCQKTWDFHIQHGDLLLIYGHVGHMGLVTCFSDGKLSFFFNGGVSCFIFFVHPIPTCPRSNRQISAFCPTDWFQDKETAIETCWNSWVSLLVAVLSRPWNDPQHIGLQLKMLWLGAVCKWGSP